MGPHISPCILYKKIDDSYVTSLKDGLTINLPCEQEYMGIHWAKESFGSLVDAHVSVP